ncbi:unnamed protein product, partial [Brenthis ino]
MLICRICLSSENVKLFNVINFGLSEPYERLMDIEISDQQELSQYICSYCSSLLLKFLAFKDKCISAYTIMKYAAKEKLNLDQINGIANHKLPYTMSNKNTIIDMEYTELITIKEEDIPIIEEIKIESSEAKKKKLKKKKKEDLLTSNSLKLEDDFIGNEDYDNENDILNNDSLFNDSLVNDTFIHDSYLSDMKVIILSEQEQLQEIEERKTSSNYINSSYKCNFCYKGFIMATTFRNHMLKHDPERGDLICDICKSRFTEPRALKAHKVHTHERKYICKLCDHVSRSSHRAKEHLKWHSGYTFDCKICGASFAKSTSHLTHIRLQHPSNNACDICGESFIGEYGLRMHKTKAHNAETNVLAQCELCEFKFLSVEALSKHLEYAKDDICNVDLKPCPHCGEGLSSEETLQEHLKEHPKEETVFCEECNRSFRTRRSHATHYQRVHLGVKLRPRRRAAGKRGESAVCEVCGYKCISKATLVYHQRIHTGEKPYQCTECPKKFSVFQRLQIHIRTHTGETPYKCKHCPKAFKHKAALNRHDRVHTGAKPYSCPHCGKSFSQSNSMKLHVNTVHLKMPAPYRNRRNKIN